jgi:hypothetical protein
MAEDVRHPVRPPVEQLGGQPRLEGLLRLARLEPGDAARGRDLDDARPGADADQIDRTGRLDDAPDPGVSSFEIESGGRLG